MDDLDDHLPRRDGAQDFLADRFLGHLVDEIAGDGERNVSLEQRDSHLAHCRAHVALTECATPAKPVEYAAEPIAQRVKHSNLLNDAKRRTQNTPADETSSAGVHPRALASMYVLRTGGAYLPARQNSTAVRTWACPSAYAGARARRLARVGHG